MEPLIASRRLEDINFTAAPSGSLRKYSKAIKRNSAAMEKWRQAMSKSGRAVPSLDNLCTDAISWLDEDSVLREVMPKAVEKAVKVAEERRGELESRARELLAQLGGGACGADQTASGGSSDANQVGPRHRSASLNSS